MKNLCVLICLLALGECQKLGWLSDRDNPSVHFGVLVNCTGSCYMMIDAKTGPIDKGYNSLIDLTASEYTAKLLRRTGNLVYQPTKLQLSNEIPSSTFAPRYYCMFSLISASSEIDENYLENFDRFASGHECAIIDSNISSTIVPSLMLVVLIVGGFM